MAARLFTSSWLYFSDQGGLTPDIRALAMSWPMCWLSCTRIRQYIPSTRRSQQSGKPLPRRAFEGGILLVAGYCAQSQNHLD